jgi:hypothetical protein
MVNLKVNLSLTNYISCKVFNMEKTLITFIPSFATFACGGSGDLAPRARSQATAVMVILNVISMFQVFLVKEVRLRVINFLAPLT